MAVTIETAVEQFTLTGSGQVLNPSFYVLTYQDVGVMQTRAGVDTDLAYNTDYFLSGLGDPGGFAVTMAVGEADDIITVYRSSPYVQNVVYDENTRFPAKTTEHALDIMEFQIQQLASVIVRAVRFPITHIEINEITTYDDILTSLSKVEHVSACVDGVQRFITVYGYVEPPL